MKYPDDFINKIIYCAIGEKRLKNTIPNMELAL